uniref:FH2 domain-containing protein 1-like n=1 Tax=Doryrhamphus excisus TaxID=161450 RepID=UPI0025AEA057|nr:FH2 domain-containing protein 1-like [Doryrhamphus excisus]XP_057923887.1 FH2 domain-containing protein 1-like [Doryrhamphus excisus]
MHVMDSISPANDSEALSIFEDRTNMEGPPPPPPPPPPPLPPPPPPPPLLPMLGDTTGGLRSKKRVRSFFWKTIPVEQVRGRTNLWTQERVQQQYQIDAHTVEELFGQSNTKTAPTRGAWVRSSFREPKDEVSILDNKRGMNIGIFLKQFKRSNQAIIDDIRHGNSEPYGVEPLRELLKLLPETDEVRKMKAYSGDVSKLSLADAFMYLLIQLPSYTARIESMLLKEEFPSACEAMRGNISALRSATKEVLGCQELHAVLHLVLQAGNILNAGGYGGNAAGFKLSSLLSLADTKANKPGMNLLHFVALEAQKKDEKLLEFPLKLLHVQAASRISVETLDSELQWLTSRTRSVEESVQMDTELLQQLDSFLQRATASLCSLRSGQQLLKKQANELIDFFCEDSEMFRLDDCFGVLHGFCCKFTNAVKDNKEREAKEAVRRSRLQVLEEQKRHSWAGGEEVGGAIGVHCSSETDLSAAILRHDKASMLLELLSPKSRPFSSSLFTPRGRAGSLRRSRHSPSTSPSLAGDRELSTLFTFAAENHQTSSASKVPPQNLPLTPTGPTNLNDHLTHVSTTLSQEDVMSDLNNNGKDDLSSVFDSKLSLSECNKCQISSAVDVDNCSAANNNKNMAVLLEKRCLVPELKAFNEVPTIAGRWAEDVPRRSTHLHGDQNDVTVRDVEGDNEDKVVVWCVTSVCEAAGEKVYNQGGSDPSSSAPGKHTPSEREHPTNSKSEPISSQPVPSSQICVTPSTAPATPELTTRQEAVSPEAEMQGSKTLTGLSIVDKRKKSAFCHVGKEATLAKTSTKSHATTSKTGTKPRQVRTLNSSENQNMRRVVPISRTSRGTPASQKPPAERASTDPSSRHSSLHKDSKEQNARNQDLQRKPLVRKLEEKICRSTLRALGSGASLSAPATPLHKGTPPSLSPGFARSTASSSFRKTHATLPRPTVPKSASQSAPLSSPASPLTKTTSLRVTTTSTSADHPHPSSSSSSSSSSVLRKTQSTKTPYSFTSPKSHKQSSSSFNKDPGHRPIWR